MTNPTTIKQGDNFKYFYDAQEKAYAKWDTITHEFAALTSNFKLKTFFIKDSVNLERFTEITKEAFQKYVAQ